MIGSIEVELKFPLLNHDDAVNELNKLGDKISDYQKDTYYTPAHRDFVKQIPVSEWLRIRKSNGKVSLNYKNWHNKHGDAVSCDEFETEVGDEELLKNIFNNLNFQELIVVEKIRNSWTIDKVEISLDRITDLGDFIELEAKGHFESIEEAKNYLYEKLKELNIQVGEQTFKGYPHLLLEKKGLL